MVRLVLEAPRCGQDGGDGAGAGSPARGLRLSLAWDMARS